MTTAAPILVAVTIHPRDAFYKLRDATVTIIGLQGDILWKGTMRETILPHPTNKRVAKTAVTIVATITVNAGIIISDKMIIVSTTTIIETTTIINVPTTTMVNTMTIIVVTTMIPTPPGTTVIRALPTGRSKGTTPTNRDMDRVVTVRRWPTTQPSVAYHFRPHTMVR